MGTQTRTTTVAQGQTTSPPATTTVAIQNGACGSGTASAQVSSQTHPTSNSANTVADPNGIRHWVVGTGGVALNTGFATTPHSTSAKRLSAFGVLKLTLHDASYDAQFIGTDGTVLDPLMGVSVH